MSQREDNNGNEVQEEFWTGVNGNKTACLCEERCKADRKELEKRIESLEQKVNALLQERDNTRKQIVNRV